MKRILYFILGISLLNAGNSRIISGEIGTDFEVKNNISKTVKDIKNTEITHYGKAKFVFFDIVDISASAGYYYKADRKNVELDKNNTKAEIGINLGLAGRTSFLYKVDNDGLTFRNNEEQEKNDDGLNDVNDKNISLINFGYAKDFNLKDVNMRVKSGYSYVFREENSEYSPHILMLGFNSNFKKEKWSLNFNADVATVMLKETQYSNSSDSTTRKITYIISPKSTLETTMNMDVGEYTLKILGELRLPFEKNFDKDGKEITQKALKDVDYKVDLDNKFLFQLNNKTYFGPFLNFSLRGKNESINGIYLEPGLILEYRALSNLKLYSNALAGMIFLRDEKEDKKLSFSRTIPRLNMGIKFEF